MFSNLTKLLFGADGGASKGDFRKARRRSRFSDFLPYIAYDREKKTYLNYDDTIGYIWECVPLVFAGDGPYSTVEALLRQGFPEGTVLQVILWTDDFIDPLLDRYVQNKSDKHPVLTEATKSYAEYIRKGKKGLDNLLGIPVRDFRLFVTLKFPAKEKVNHHDVRNSVTETLKGAKLQPKFFEPENLLDMLRRFFNDEPSLNNADYDPNRAIRKQIILDSEISWDKEKMQIGKKKVLRCATAKKLPDEIHPLKVNELVGGISGASSDINQIPTPFMIAINVMFHNVRPGIDFKTNFLAGQNTVASMAPSLSEKRNEFMFASTDLQKGTTYVRVMPICWVWGDDDQKASEAMNRLKRMWEQKGFIMQEDLGILQLLLISALPFGLYDLDGNVDDIERDFILPADVATRFFPIQTDFAGGGDPIQVFVGRKGQICTSNIFAENATNHNIFIAATSGGGKSFLMNDIVSSYVSYGAYARVIDIGGSYKKFTRMLGAEFMDFTWDSNICLNPLASIGSGDAEDLQKNIGLVSQLVHQMAYSATYQIPPENAETEISLIKDGIKWALENEGVECLNPIDMVSIYLRDFPKYDTEFSHTDMASSLEHFRLVAHKLWHNLKDFTSAGAYGRWFNGKSTFNISDNPLVVLELENLKAQPELFRIITIQVTNATTSELYLSDRSTPRLIIFDEAHMFIKDGSAIKAVIEEGYRRARKYFGSFSIITQSIADIKGFGSVGDVVFGNSAFKYFLESRDFDRVRAEKIIDYDDFTMDLLTSVKTNKPLYSEIFMDTPNGCGVARFCVDPYKYWVNTSSGAEIAVIESIVDRGFGYNQAVRHMALNMDKISAMEKQGMERKVAMRLVADQMV